LPLVLHVDLPQPPLRAVDDEDETGGADEGDEGNGDVVVVGPGENDDGVDDDETDAGLGGPDPCESDPELVGGGECEEGVDHLSGGQSQDGDEPDVIAWGGDEVIGQDQGAEEDVVEEVVHEEAPLDQTGVPASAHSPVKKVGDVLRHDHHRAAPEPV